MTSGEDRKVIRDALRACLVDAKNEARIQTLTNALAILDKLGANPQGIREKIKQLFEDPMIIGDVLKIPTSMRADIWRMVDDVFDESTPTAPAGNVLECKWTDDPEGYWATACGHAYVLIDGNPESNNMEYCCYCGGKIAAKTTGTGRAG